MIIIYQLIHVHCSTDLQWVREFYLTADEAIQFNLFLLK